MNTNASWNSSYGIIKIRSMDNCIYEWSLQIDHLKTKNELLLLGIVDYQGDHCCNMLTEHDRHYVLHCCGILLQHRKNSVRLFGGECTQGTKIKFRLNLKTKQISLVKDGKDLGVIFR
eukprot:789756_1